MIFEWKSVEDENPEVDEYIILKVKKEQCVSFAISPYSIGHYESGKYYAVGGLQNRIVTDWAYIPK